MEFPWTGPFLPLSPIQFPRSRCHQHKLPLPTWPLSLEPLHGHCSPSHSWESQWSWHEIMGFSREKWLKFMDNGAWTMIELSKTWLQPDQPDQPAKARGFNIFNRQKRWFEQQERWFSQQQKQPGFSQPGFDRPKLECNYNPDLH